MEKVQAKHAIGDRIRVKLGYDNNQHSLVFFGNIKDVKEEKGNIFPDQIVYDVSLERAEGPTMEMTNLSEKLIIAGGEKEYDEEQEKAFAKRRK